MAGVRNHSITAKDDGMRLDRWLRSLVPGLTQGVVQKLIRTGQVRVDGKRIKANHRLAEGEVIRVPPLPSGTAADKDANHRADLVRHEDADLLPSRIVHRDGHVIVIDKPAGLAVQGGAKTIRHVDGLLDTLRFDRDERPRLVHRLDKDTSGLLVVARDRETARTLTAAFRTREVKKLYWAVTAGTLPVPEGTIDAALIKSPSGKGSREKMVVNPERGDRAVTNFRVIDRAGDAAAWVALQPETGRTHQLRVHLAACDAPILGDGKYGGASAHPNIAGISKSMHLHARRLSFRLPGEGVVDCRAPAPSYLTDTLRILGLEDVDHDADMFLD